MLPCSSLERRGFLLTTLPNNPCLFSLFLIVPSWILTSKMLAEGSRVSDVALGLFAVSLNIALSDLGVRFQGYPYSGRWVFVLNVFHLWTIFPTAEWWISNCLQRSYESSQTDGQKQVFFKIIANIKPPNPLLLQRCTWISLYFIYFLSPVWTFGKDKRKESHAKLLSLSLLLNVSHGTRHK